MSNQLLSAEYEQKLAEQAKTDENAFRQLYDWYLPKVYGYILKKTGHRETAEDIIADTFMKAFANIDRYEYKGVSFGAWLYRIATNSLVDHYRKNKKYSGVDIDEMLDLAGNDEADNLALSNENKKQVEKIMNKLPQREKTVLELKFFAELSNQEISQVLEISVGNVGVILYRALKKCQKLTNNN